RLTPPDEPAGQRTRALAAARAHLAAGEWTRTRTIASELLARSDPGPARAEVLVVLAEVESVERAADLLEQALSEAAGQPSLEAEIGIRLAWANRFRRGFARSADHARAALAIADALDDDGLRLRALAMLTRLSFVVADARAPLYAARIE